MSFADPGDTTASRSFQEAVYYLDASFQSLFEPLGMRTDKHGREHEVFRLTASAPAIDAALESLGVGPGPGDPRGVAGRAASIAATSRRACAACPRSARPMRVGLVAGVLAVVARDRGLAGVAGPSTRARPRPPRAEPAAGDALATRRRSPVRRRRPRRAAPGDVCRRRRAATTTSGGRRAGPRREHRRRRSARRRARAPARPREPGPGGAARPGRSARRQAGQTAGGPARRARWQERRRPRRPQASPRAHGAAAGTESTPGRRQRCSRLLQRAAVGEVLTPDEQRELTSSCR